jgi:hypothetical protein
MNPTSECIGFPVSLCLVTLLNSHVFGLGMLLLSVLQRSGTHQLVEDKLLGLLLSTHLPNLSTTLNEEFKRTFHQWFGRCDGRVLW